MKEALSLPRERERTLRGLERVRSNGEILIVFLGIELRQGKV